MKTVTYKYENRVIDAVELLSHDGNVLLFVSDGSTVDCAFITMQRDCDEQTALHVSSDYVNLDVTKATNKALLATLITNLQEIHDSL